MRFRPLLQYFCSSCGRILKNNSTIEIQNQQIKEECPSCGALLVDTLQNRTMPEQAVFTNAAPKSLQDLSVDFRTAFHQIEDNSVKFAFDIAKIDSLLNLNANGSLCIVGEQKYTQLLIDRLCIHSMLPRRHGGTGLNYSKIITIDAGNCTDIYQVVDFARQYGLEIEKVLKNIVVSRVFTIYQLADLVVHKLPEVIQQFSSEKNRLIVIYDLLHLFVSDPHIDKADTKQLIKEIADSIRKISKDRFVLVSFAHSNNSEHKKLLVRAFENCIEITNDVDDNRAFQIDVYSRNHTMKRRDSRTRRLMRLDEREISLVTPR